MHQLNFDENFPPLKNSQGRVFSQSHELISPAYSQIVRTQPLAGTQIQPTRPRQPCLSFAPRYCHRTIKVVPKVKRHNKTKKSFCCKDPRCPCNLVEINQTSKLQKFLLAQKARKYETALLSTIKSAKKCVQAYAVSRPHPVLPQNRFQHLEIFHLTGGGPVDNNHSKVGSCDLYGSPPCLPQTPPLTPVDCSTVEAARQLTGTPPHTERNNQCDAHSEDVVSISGQAPPLSTSGTHSSTTTNSKRGRPRKVKRGGKKKSTQ